MELLNTITSAILTALGVFVAFKFVYIVLGILLKRKEYPDTDERRNMAIIIAARNEAKVIGNLIDSLHKQNYDKDKITIFVVADNCTDNTAEICREMGAIVYERFDKTKARKGWGLEFLFDNIERDYGITSFDGFIFFDADNLVDGNFVMEMNKAAATGVRVAVGYRNTKNFESNFVASAYGIHFCRSTLTYHRGRNWLNCSTHIAGTGYYVASDILKNGWHYHSLTEDAEFTMDLISGGEKVAFVETAEFYDEQPTSLVVAWKQRLRWTRGRLVCFFKGAGKEIKGLFKGKFLNRWSNYDNFWYMFPYALFTFLIGAIYPVTSAIITLISGQPLPWLFWLKSVGTAIATTWVSQILIGALVLIREHKHIKCSVGRQIAYLLLFPWFELINIPLLICSCFIDVKWNPIEHKINKKIEMLTDTPADEQPVVEVEEQTTEDVK